MVDVSDCIEVTVDLCGSDCSEYAVVGAYAGWADYEVDCVCALECAYDSAGAAYAG